MITSHKNNVASGIILHIYEFVLEHLYYLLLFLLIVVEIIFFKFISGSITI